MDSEFLAAVLQLIELHVQKCNPDGSPNEGPNGSPEGSPKEALMKTHMKALTEVPMEAGLEALPQHWSCCLCTGSIPLCESACRPHACQHRSWSRPPRHPPPKLWGRRGRCCNPC